MLDYNLESMTGPKQKNLIIRDPDQYHFKPQNLLSDIMSVYTNLRGQQSFIVAVARDGRSYKKYNFAHAGKIIATKTSLKSQEELEDWQKLCDAIEKAKELEDQAEEDYGDIPDEFLDPIMATLMEDPVLLPTSKMVTDRSTIRSHLLSDKTDPFNRQPLAMEDLVADTALKARIDAFKAEAKARRYGTPAPGVDNPDVMDLTL
jgi:ubiquitin conjugation factor E4 B